MTGSTAFSQWIGPCNGRRDLSLSSNEVPMTFAILSTLFLPTEAEACGGFFCNNDPIDQAGEDIVFRVDQELGRTEMHVQIAYTGTAEEFAWIVPVGGEPVLGLSTDALFQQLQWITAPRFNLEAKAIGDCAFDWPRYPYDYSLDASAGGPPASANPEDGGVTVVSEQEVGPYETVVLKATSATALLDWLQGRKFVLPDDLDPVLAPYIAEDAYFVALRLGKDRDVGELQPLALTYPGTAMAVPIRLTAIAATEDMRMRAFVFGDHRAVPGSYLHVIVNDLVVDWFSWGSNWEDAITVAADEAGGHAFATDYSGPADVLAGALYEEGRFDTDQLAQSEDVFAFFDGLLQQGFQGSALMLELFREYLPMPQEFVTRGYSEQDFYNCLRCDPWADVVATMEFDAEAFATAIQERIVEPRAEAQEMIDDAAHLTRLTSSVSPVEMTVDPTFVFNADMTQDVALDRNATVEHFCEKDKSWTQLERRLVLPDGRGYRLPSMEWFWEQNLTEYEYLRALMDDFALIIEQTSGEGPPVPLYDGTERAGEVADAHNATFDALPQSCGGCSSSGPLGASVALTGALGLVLLRRRRD